MSEPTVSVIVALYNKQDTIARTLNSIFSQAYKSVEVIVVDDGSTDESLRALEPFMDRIEYIWQQNAGPSAARNRGIRRASGKYVAFLDADDYWLQGFLSSTSEFLQLHPRAGVVSVSYLIKTQDDRLRPARGGRRPDDGVVPDFFEAYSRAGFCCTGSILARKSALVSVDGFREDLQTGEDLELWLCLGATTVWGFLNRGLLVVDRTEMESLTRADPARRLAVSAPFSNWERRIIDHLGDKHSLGYRRVRQRFLWTRLKFLFLHREYGRVHSLASEYRRKLGIGGGLVLGMISVFPNFVLGLLRGLWELRLCRIRHSRGIAPGKQNGVHSGRIDE